VDVLTGAGLAGALDGADVLVDVTNSPNLDGGPAQAFFAKSTANLVEVAKRARVGHYVALSIVGADALPDSGYLVAKVNQERIIRESGIPYSIVRATQFADFAEAIVDSFTAGNDVRVPDALIQLIGSDQVAAAVAAAAAAAVPINGFRNVGGPMKVTFEQMVRETLAQKGDTTKTIAVDPNVEYFGTKLERDSLVTPD
jgi:uncharacterized protein YbjT (DUF2867 family)